MGRDILVTMATVVNQLNALPSDNKTYRQSLQVIFNLIYQQYRDKRLLIDDCIRDKNEARDSVMADGVVCLLFNLDYFFLDKEFNSFYIDLF